ncbi:DUF1592 domain-containing protein [Planctomycetes bacterium K23_9]|uniref:Planctomycete cytochrome C n=1 Tax=Stieleria marina TaxID=1930275 RepID=A0A517NUX3_9BACT|nr:hypothetical protein K239x_29190 [Planctomycetes bacterium K23_9]
MKHMFRTSLALIALALCGSVSSAQEAQAAINAAMSQEHLAVFKKYCFDCHDAATQEGKLNLQDLSFEISKDGSTAEHWDSILAALNSNEMPPENAEQIPDDEKAAFLKVLSEQMVHARNILGDSGGEITMRRMNRREYQNTLEALLGFRADVSTLPDDDSSGGFDTSGGSLFFSSDQFEQYRATATQALEYALSRKPRPEPRTVRFEGETIPAAYMERAKNKRESYKRAKAFLAQDEKSAADFGFPHPEQAKNICDKHEYAMAVYDNYFFNRPESKTGTILLPGRRNGPVKQMPRLQVPAWYPGGTYKVRLKAASYDDAKDQHRYIQVQFQAGKNEFTNLQGLTRVTGSIKNPQLIELELQNPVGVKGNFRVRQRHYEEPWRYKLDIQQMAKNGVGSLPAVWVDYVEVDGPYFDEELQQLPRMLKRIRGASDEQYARTVIARFATKAFRNKAPDSEFLDKLVRYYLNRRGSGDDSRSAMIKSLALVLSSPSFVYLLESGEPAALATGPSSVGHERPATTTDRSRRLNDRELAIRLAYFLWSSPPDEALMAAANDGSLSDPEILKAQTTRLLGDARSARFVSGFAHQWLDMKRIDMFDFSAIEFPEFDESVRRSARQEVYETIRLIQDAKLPISTLLKSDFVMINDVLADFYGLNEPASSAVGSEFRKVTLPAGSPRGGLLGTAAIHIMGSDGQRSSPVERGAWVLRHVINDPPPPAPPNIPMLEHGDAVLSIRNLQKRHQSEPQCASCHRKIDPIGYGLENFNAAGLWRDVEEVKIPSELNGKRKRKNSVPKVKRFPIDPTGELPGGEQFASYQELRDSILANYHDTFARGFSENLLAYGLGRPYGISDHNLATKMTLQAAENGNTLPAFIHALVQSKAFQSK